MAAKKENRYNRKWSDEELINQFVKAYEYARKSNKCLCLEDAIAQTDLPYSTYFYWADKQKDLDSIRKDTLIEVKRKVNAKTLEGGYNPAAGIWRMKQCGEKDTQHQDLTTNGKDMNIPVQNWVSAKESSIDKLDELSKNIGLDE